MWIDNRPHYNQVPTAKVSTFNDEEYLEEWIKDQFETSNIQWIVLLDEPQECHHYTSQVHGIYIEDNVRGLVCQECRSTWVFMF